MNFASKSALAAVFAMAGGAASAETIGGIEFPDGERSFADEVVSFIPGTGTGFYSGPPNEVLDGLNFADPTNALGSPDADPLGVALGVLGELVVKFTDNALTTSGDDSDDLYIFEIGPLTEAVQVAISTDGSTWIELGEVVGTQVPAFDIDGVEGVVQGEAYQFVRIIDSLTDGPGLSGIGVDGADINGIGAISSIDVPPAAVPLPASAALLLAGLGGLAATRRKAK